MREYLLRMILDQPFVPFTLLLDGGHVVDVLHPEFVILDPSELFATIYTPAGHRQYLDVDKIVTIRTIHPVED